MNVMVSSKAKSNLIGLLVVVVILFIFFLSGPAKALIVFLTPPNDAERGNDVAFNILVVITPPDTFVPIQFTDITFTGPDGFHKVCRVNIDGTDNCPDVDIFRFPFPIHRGFGHRFALDWNYSEGGPGGYGYWYPTWGYDFGYGYGYGYGGYGYGYGYGGMPQFLAYHVIWHTSTTLTPGTYDARGGTYVNGGPGPGGHTYLSVPVPFDISGEEENGRRGGGGGGGSTCGNGICDPNENYTNCPQDCPASGPGGNQTNQTNPPTKPSTGGTQTGLGGLLSGKSLWIIIAILAIALISFFIIRVRKKK